MTAGGGVSVVGLKRHLRESTGTSEAVERGARERHVNEVGPAIDFESLIQRGEPFEIDNGFVGCHAHGHADDERGFEEIGQRFARSALKIFDDAFELGGVGGVERVETRTATEEARCVVHGFVFNRAAHSRPDDETQRRRRESPGYAA